MREADFQSSLPGGEVRCDLCPRACVIAPGRTGFCRVRRNDGGRLVALSFGRPAALQVDPVEKKPLAFFLPGTRTFSLGTFGCNLDCAFCQNFELSRGGYGSGRACPAVSPEEIVQMALSRGCRSISFTYNEPAVFIEYAVEIAKLARQAGLKTILVSNGWINPAPAAALYRLIDAANIDVKGFSEEFYGRLCNATLAPVLRSCEFFRNECGGHLELTNLVIPGQNDSPQMIDALLDWVEEKLGADTPLHFSAYFPCHRYCDSPPTPRETLFSIREHAAERGFTRIRLGNIR